MRFSMPTEVKTDPAALARCAAFPLPVPQRNGMATVWRCDRYGLLAILAQAHRELGPLPDRGEWTGVLSDDDAATLALDGWREPVKDILSQARAVKVHAMRSLTPRVGYADEPGECVDVSRYLDGEDCHFEVLEQTAIENTGRGAVRIVIEPCVSAGIGTDAIIQRGAIVVAIVWALERAGVRTAIAYQSHITADADGRQDVTVHCDIKRYRDPVSVAHLAYWLCHNSASRVLVFAACQMSKHIVKGTGSRHIDIGWGRRKPVARDAVECPMLHTRDLATVEEWIAIVAKKAGVSWTR